MPSHVFSGGRLWNRESDPGGAAPLPQPTPVCDQDPLLPLQDDHRQLRAEDRHEHPPDRHHFGTI